jgi:hypothetical protein
MHYSHQCQALSALLDMYHSSGDISVLQDKLLTAPAAALALWDKQHWRRSKVVRRRPPPQGSGGFAGRGSFQPLPFANQFGQPGPAYHGFSNAAAAAGPGCMQFSAPADSYGPVAHAGMALPPLRTRLDGSSPVQRPTALVDRLDFRAPSSDAAAAGEASAPQPPASSSSKGSAPAGFISVADHEAKLRKNLNMISSAAAFAAVQVQQQVTRAYQKRERDLKDAHKREMKTVFRE